MSTDDETSTRAADRMPRYLGAAFTFQFVTSLTAGLLSASLLDGSTSQVLSDISNSPGQLRLTVVLELLTSLGIVVMTALLYVVLRRQGRTVALVALALWMSEAVFLTVKTLALSVLLGLTQEPDAAGGALSAARSSGHLALDVAQHAGDIDMLFFCVGAMLWYFLLYRSRIVPRALAVWGLVAVPLVLVATLMLIWDRSLDPSRVLYAPYVPFELTIGLWLLIKGASASSTAISAGSSGTQEEAEARTPHPVACRRPNPAQGSSTG